MLYAGIFLQVAGSNTASIIMMVGMVAVMYFFMIRPQQKKQREQRKFIDELKKGDEVVTLGGMCGKVIEIDDKKIHLEVAPRVKIAFERNSISYESTKVLKEEVKK